ncbi:MAG: GTP cyclohydrolase I [Chlamydiales bacterium]|nr:GTP cyclohydrolase I [Chlamydiales bacterium]
MSIEYHFAKIMELLGLDLNDPSLAKTPARVAKMYEEEVFTGLVPDNFPDISLIPWESTQEITVHDISFVSFCEHHFLPMYGKTTVSYVPNGSILGLGTIHQVVHHFANRPQLQERLTDQIARTLANALSTEVVVNVIAEHSCVRARGVRDKNSLFETTSCCPSPVEVDG